VLSKYFLGKDVSVQPAPSSVGPCALLPMINSVSQIERMLPCYCLYIGLTVIVRTRLRLCYNW